MALEHFNASSAVVVVDDSHAQPPRQTAVAKVAPRVVVAVVAPVAIQQQVGVQQAVGGAGVVRGLANWHFAKRFDTNAHTTVKRVQWRLIMMGQVSWLICINYCILCINNCSECVVGVVDCEAIGAWREHWHRARHGVARHRGAS